jgi:hypothetical protein
VGVGAAVVPVTVVVGVAEVVVVVAKIVVVGPGVGAVGGPAVGAVTIPSHNAVPLVVPQTCGDTHVNFTPVTAPEEQVFEK